MQISFIGKVNERLSDMETLLKDMKTQAAILEKFAAIQVLYLMQQVKFQI